MHLQGADLSIESEGTIATVLWEVFPYMCVRPIMLVMLLTGSVPTTQEVAAQCIPPDITLEDLAVELPRLDLAANDSLAMSIRLAVEDHADALATICAELMEQRDAALGVTPKDAQQRARVGARAIAMRRWSEAQRHYNALREQLVTARNVFEQRKVLQQARTAVQVAKTQLDQVLQNEPVAIRHTSPNVALALMPLLERSATESDIRNLDLAEGIESLLMQEEQRRIWLEAVYRGRRHRSLQLGHCPMSRADALLILDTANINLTGPNISPLVETFLPTLHATLGRRNHVHSALGEYAWRQGANGNLRLAAEAALIMANADSAVAQVSQEFIVGIASQLEATDAERLRKAWNEAAHGVLMSPTIVEVFAARSRSSVPTETAKTIDALLEEYRPARLPIRNALIAASGVLAGRLQAIALATRSGVATDEELHAVQRMRAAEATALEFDQQWLAELASLLPDGPIDLPLISPSRPASKLVPVPYPSTKAVPSPEQHSESDTVVDSPLPEEPTSPPPVTPPAPEDD